MPESQGIRNFGPYKNCSFTGVIYVPTLCSLYLFFLTWPSTLDQINWLRAITWHLSEKLTFFWELLYFKTSNFPYDFRFLKKKCAGNTPNTKATSINSRSALSLGYKMAACASLWWRFVQSSGVFTCTLALTTSMGLVRVEAVAAAIGPATACSRRWGQLDGASRDSCSVSAHNTHCISLQVF